MRESHLEKMFSMFQELSGVTFSSDYKVRIVELRNLYLKIMSDIFEIDSKYCIPKIPIDNPLHIYNEFICFVKFLQDGARIYKLCENFGHDLFKTNLDVPVNMIPNVNETLCIEFPDSLSIKNPDGAFFKTVYIRQSDDFKEKNSVYHGIRFQFPDYAEDGGLKETSSFINIEINDNYKTVSELLSRTPNLTKDFQMNVDAIHFAFKAYLYLHSGEPDLRFQKHIEYPTTKKEKKRRHFFDENKGKFVDLTLLGYDHKKGKLYSVDSFDVSGHFRWQRYGEALQKIKLIWLDGYIKHPQKTFKNILNGEQNEINKNL